MDEDKGFIGRRYLQRRRPKFIPKGEILRDYYRHDLTPTDFLFDSDYEEAEKEKEYGWINDVNESEKDE